jgi:phosphatidylglycerophosphate synthase
LGAFAFLVATRIEYSMWRQIALWLGAGLFVQLRLLCNLFDGMLAVEFKKASPLGPIYNDLPDRPADVLILAGAGYSLSLFAWLPTIGWIAAVLALMTAYVRVLGVAVGAPESFVGPMAKPHRMAVVTMACAFAALETLTHWPHRVMALALVVVSVGCIITIARRLKLVANALLNP